MVNKIDKSIILWAHFDTNIFILYMGSIKICKMVIYVWFQNSVLVLINMLFIWMIDVF